MGFLDRLLYQPDYKLQKICYFLGKPVSKDTWVYEDSNICIRWGGSLFGDNAMFSGDKSQVNELFYNKLTQSQRNSDIYRMMDVAYVCNRYYND